MLPADVVGQVEQELLPCARTRETVGQSPGLQGYLLELGIYIPERLAGQVNHSNFLSPKDSMIGTPAANPRRIAVCSLRLFHRKHLDRINGAQHSEPAHHRGHSAVDRSEHFLACS